MPKGVREFRSSKSLADEKVVRGRIAGLLESHGLVVLSDKRKGPAHAQSQIVEFRSSEGLALKALVRLCWTRRGTEHQDISAAQLTSKLKNGDVEATLEQIERRNEREALTHHLIALYDLDYGDFVHALLVPADQLTLIWRAQREAAERLIATSNSGSMKKNPAMNGNSPTIWLEDVRDSRRDAYTGVPWNWPEVINVMELPRPSGDTSQRGDTLDDLDAWKGDLGRDAGLKAAQQRSGYRRNGRVRDEVRQRAKGMCERPGCRAHRDYPGFLDVHHILGIATSDRVWTCVALCPNCHREAHYAQDRDALNIELRDYAERFHNDGNLRSKRTRLPNATANRS